MFTSCCYIVKWRGGRELRLFTANRGEEDGERLARNKVKLQTNINLLSRLAAVWRGCCCCWQRGCEQVAVLTSTANRP